MADAEQAPAAKSRMLGKIARMADISAERNRSSQPDTPSEAASNVALPPEPRKANQPSNFFTAPVCDVGTRDSQVVLDVAIFRLSKKEHRPNDVIRYELPDGYVTVTSSAHGMASIWDYDIVIMAISYLIAAMNSFHAGKGPKPGPAFRPHISDVMKFCRRDNGGKQRDQLAGALDRLTSTYVSINRTQKINGRLVTIKRGANLIAEHQLIDNVKTGKVEFIEIYIPNWMYLEIVEGKTFNVLTVHPDYFLIEKGLGRFIYRIARKAAGKDSATWGVQTLYERSGSTGTFKEFCRILRKIISDDYFPEYVLTQIMGRMGPMLVMTYKGDSDTEA